jgi:hypothetical protein
MFNLDELRVKFHSLNDLMSRVSGLSYSHMLGECVGMATVVAIVLDIQWIEADFLLRSPLGTQNQFKTKSGLPAINL